MNKDKSRARIGLTLEGEMLKRFQAVKHKWGIESNADVIRFLITQEYERIVKT
jgi:hypothetical protein